MLLHDIKTSGDEVALARDFRNRFRFSTIEKSYLNRVRLMRNLIVVFDYLRRISNTQNTARAEKVMIKQLSIDNAIYQRDPIESGD